MLTDEEFRLFRTIVYEESGMFLKEEKKDFLEHRLVKRMKAVNIATPYWYYRFLVENKRQELFMLLDSLTINETSFFRNMPQFDLFRNMVLPDVIARNRETRSKSLRIWSAGSSTGEEPYSIAMTLLDAFPDGHDWDIRIFASDISMKSLETAHRGVYAPGKVRESVPDKALARYFEAAPGGLRICDKVRNMVVFDYHNLKHENGMGNLDVVFCRNVMIYFDEEEQKRLVNKLYRSLSPEGYLLLGHAESLYGWNLNFRFIFDSKGAAYQKIEGVRHEDPDRRGR